jgi:hypothetical protein
MVQHTYRKLARTAHQMGKNKKTRFASALVFVCRKSRIVTISRFDIKEWSTKTCILSIIMQCNFTIEFQHLLISLYIEKKVYHPHSTLVEHYVYIYY